MSNKKHTSSTNKLIHQSIDERLAQTVVLLNRQYEIIQHLFSKREIEVLRNFENEMSSGSQTVQSLYPVYEYIFSLIDNLVRYQKILNVTPKISQKEKPIVEYNKVLEPLKQARNQIQHINNDIENSFSGSLLGSICWNRGLTQYIISLVDIGRSRSTPSIALNTHTGSFVAELCYVYNEIYYDLHKAVSETQAIHEWLSNTIIINIDGAAYDPNSYFHSLKVEFNLNPN